MATTTINTYIAVSDSVELTLALDGWAGVLDALNYDYPPALLDRDRWADLIGDGFSILLPERTLHLQRSVLPMDSLIFGFNPNTVPDLKQPLIEFDLQIRDEYVAGRNKDHDYHSYKPAIIPGFWVIMREMAARFPQSGVFVSIDGCDGDQWHVLIGGSARHNLWSFDLALLPRALARHFTPVPSGFMRAHLPYGVGLAMRALWPTLPWELPTAADEG